MIYVHNDRSISSDNFIRHVLLSEAIRKELEQHCVLWPCDVTEESNKSKLLSSLMQCSELNSPVPFPPAPFCLRKSHFSTAPKKNALARHVCARINSFSSPNEFPRLYIVISSPEFGSKVVRSKKQRMSPLVGAPTSSASATNSASSLQPLQPQPSTAFAVQNASINPPLSAYKYYDPSTSSSLLTPSSASAHTGQAIAFASKAPGNAANSQSDHRSDSYCVFEIEPSTMTAAELLVKLQCARNNGSKCLNKLS